jgi:maspardin
MRKILAAGALAAAAGAAYAIPRPRREFDDLYAGVDGPTRDSLAVFRARHAPEVLDVGGAVWRYASLGDDADTVLFLHGMGGAYDIWWQQLEALAPRLRVISVTYPPVAGLEALAAGVEAVLRTEGVETVHVVGTSLGGYLAQYLVATRPERVDSAVFANTFPPNDILFANNRVRGTVAPLLPEWALFQRYARYIRDEVVPAAGGSPLVEGYLLEQAYGGMSKQDFVARYRCVVDHFAAPDPKVPVLLVESDNDPLVPEQLRGMLRATYPGAETVTLQGVGHFPYLSVPVVFTQVLKRFLPF